MHPLTALWTDLRVLVVDTGKVWWRLLPRLMAVYLLGWLAFQVALKVAAFADGLSPWVTLVIFAAGFLTQLIAVVVMLRMAGRELGIGAMIPDGESAGDDRDSSVTHLLAVTLLPFLGLYAAFGEVNKAATRLTTEQFVKNGVFGDQGLLGFFNSFVTEHPWRLAAILAGTYVVRRVFDHLHEHTGFRPLGVLVALVESFFILTVVLGGIRIWQVAKLWLSERAFVGWFAQAKDLVLDALSVISIRIPGILTRFATFVADEIWPLFWQELSQPIIWLAVAALVFGSQVMSVAELWRQGQPVRQKVAVVTPFASRAQKLAERRTGPPPAGVTKAALEFREAFLGDIDDKYLPTFHSVRLVLRAGAIFLGAFVLVYSLVAILKNYFEVLVLALIGGRDVSFWIVANPAIDLLLELPFEPLRLVLLAVAFRRCLELFRSRDHLEDPAAAKRLSMPATGPVIPVTSRPSAPVPASNPVPLPAMTAPPGADRRCRR